MANIIEIVIKQTGQGNAISATVKELGGLDSAASNSIGILGKFGGALTNMATVAGGIVVANIFGKIAEGITSVISTGLDAVGSNQQLETSLKSLLTANNMYAETTQSVTTAVTKQLMTQDEYGVKVQELTAKLKTQQATYQEQQERIRQLTEQYGENGLVVIKSKAQHEQLALAMEKTQREIDGLTTSETKYVTSTKTSIETVMSQADAFKLASAQTQDLLDFVSKLAVTSPFETETVEDVTKYAIAAGMGVDATKEFIPAFLDLAGAVGITSESLGFAADQLFQVKKVGKLTEIDLRQLRRIGIDLSKVIGVEMGMSVDEFNAAAAKSPEIFDELFDAVTRFSQNTFAGTSKEMATSVKGLQSTISDIFVIGSRTFMRPLVDAVTPAAAAIIGKLSDFVLGGDLAGIGQQLADSIVGGMAFAEQAITKVMGAFETFGARGAAVSILGQLGLDTGMVSKAERIIAAVQQTISGLREGNEIRVLSGSGMLANLLGLDPQMVTGIFSTVNDIVINITEAIDKISGAFDRFGARGAMVSILGILGLDPETIGLIDTTLTDVTTTITESFDKIKGAFDRFGTEGAVISILGQLGMDPETIGLIRTNIDEIILAIDNFSTSVGESLGRISNAFGEGGFSAAFATMAGEILAGIPSILTSIVDGIAAFFRDNWPTIQATLTEWATKFWEWANTAISGAGSALAGILLAITAWATSPEAQTSLNNMGQELGKALQEGIQFLFENQGEAAAVLLKIVAGLAAAAAVVAGDLIIIGGQLVAGMISGMIEAMGGPELQPALVSELQGILNGMAENVATIVREVAKKIVRTLADAIKTALNSDLGRAFSGVVAIIKEDLGESLSYVSDDLLPLLGEGIDLVTQGVKNFISSLKEAASTLADMVVPDWLEMHSPPPLATALNMSSDAASRATAGLANMQRQMITSSGAAHDFIDSLDMGGIAVELGGHGTAWKNWRRILGQNISANMGNLAAGMSPAEIMNQVGNVAAQWRLPPGVVTDLAEANGLVEHLTDNFAAFQQQMRIENLGNMIQMGGQFASLSSGFADMLTNMMAGKDEAQKTAAEYRKLTETLGGQETQLATLKEELALLQAAEEQDTSAIKQKEKAIDDLTRAMDKNRESLLKTTEGYQRLQAEAFNLFSGNQNESQRIGSELATIALLQDFLASGAESLLIPADAVSQAAGITGILYDQISGQQELNRLLAEQAEREALITQQKEAQQKLDFLKAQLDLIKLGRELGGNIFQGITFGLDASVEDLLAATNAVTAAMVEQINQDLQIASPSKLLFKLFRDNVGGAMVGGLLAVKPLMQGAIAPILNPVMQGAQAAGRVVNNYFNQTVNTQADQSTVIGDFRTMQLMAGS